MEIEKRVAQAARVLRLDLAAIRNVSDDPASKGMGMNIAALGGFIGALALIIRGEGHVFGLVMSPIIAVLGVAALAGVVRLMSKLIHGKGTFQHLFRPMLYASMLTWLNALKVIPGVDIALDFAIGAWLLVTVTIITREVEKFSTFRAVVAVVLPVFVLSLLIILIEALLTASA